MNGSSCPTCGWALRWLPEQGAWGCDQCRKVVAAAHPMMPPGPGYAVPPPGRRSSKGLAIGLGLGAVAVAGTIIAVVVATGGGEGGGGHGSREDLVKGALAAMGAGDVDQLVKLSDPVGLHHLALDCSERDQAQKVREKDPDDDDPDRDRDREPEDDPGDADDPQIQEKRVRRQHEKLVEKTKGMKLELVSIGGAQDRRGADADADADADAKGLTMKKGDKATKGCVFKVDVALHELVAKVRVTEPDAKEPAEQEVKLEAIEAGGSWYLMAAPKVSAGGGKLGGKLRAFRDQICACKDVACADKIYEEAMSWARSRRDAFEQLSKDEQQALEEIGDEGKACRRKLREGDEAGETQRALAKLEDFKAKMCACADGKCAERVQQEMIDWSASLDPQKNTRPRDEDQQRATEIMMALTECMTRVMTADLGGPPDDPPPPDDDDATSGGGAELASLPACAAYRRQIDKARGCPKYPPSATAALSQGYAQLEQGWPAMRANPAARDQMIRSCEAAAGTLEKALEMMCP